MTSEILHTDKVLENIVSQIVRIASPDKIILFGSRATGKAKKDSDYDICVLKARVRHNRKLAYKIRSSINELIALDLVISTLSDYEQLKHSSFYVYSDIEKFGKVIYEKNGISPRMACFC